MTLIVFQEDCRAVATFAVYVNSVTFGDVRHRAIVGTISSSALFETEAGRRRRYRRRYDRSKPLRQTFDVGLIEL